MLSWDKNILRERDLRFVELVAIFVRCEPDSIGVWTNEIV
jgi:hypothetical protein